MTHGRASRALGLAVSIALSAVAAAPLAAATSPTPGPPGGIPSQAQVDGAKAAAASAAQQVASLEAQYLSATARLAEVQSAVSAKAAAYAAAQQVLDERTQAADSAQASADRAADEAAAAATALSRMAATAYEEGNPTAQLTLTMVVSGPERAVALADYLDGQGSSQNAALQRAALTAGVADDDRRIATDRREQQRRATADAADALSALQEQLSLAQTRAADLGAQQSSLVDRLAALQNTSAQLQQERLDGLAAQRAAEAAARAAQEQAARRRAEQQAAERAAAEQAAQQAARQVAEQAARAPSAPAPAPVGTGPTPIAVITPAQRNPRAIAQQLMPAFGFGTDQWSCLDSLWVGESGWNWAATNPYSGAYGIPQALPATKMASAGADWLTNPATQITWGLSYIKGRYGSPCAAWNAWQARSPHWY